MPTNALLWAIVLVVAVISDEAQANEGHKNAIYHAFLLDVGIGGTDDGVAFIDWDIDGWIGTDEDKLWWRGEGEREDNNTEQAEFWAMYSRYIGTFWDMQLGLRHDTKPDSVTYGVIGFGGLAPYFFETDAHMFVSDKGDISVRLRQENVLFITQQLMVHPYFEVNLFAQDVPELDMGAGIAQVELGLQTRYELTRSFALFVGIKYERLVGETSSIAMSHGEEVDIVIGTVGVSFLL